MKIKWKNLSAGSKGTVYASECDFVFADLRLSDEMNSR